jgi:hypothetical protein
VSYEGVKAFGRAQAQTKGSKILSGEFKLKLQDPDGCEILTTEIAES